MREGNISPKSGGVDEYQSIHRHPPRSQMFSQCFYLSLGIQNINNFQRGDLPEKVEGGNKVILAGLISSPPHAIWEAPLNSIFVVWSLFILKFVQKAHLPAFLLLHACLTFSLITVSLDGLACRFLFSWKLYSNFPTMKIGPTSCYCWKHSDTWNPQFPVRLIGMITWRAWPPHKCVRGGL